MPATRFKRTKIIATVGPATDNYKSITELIKAGANGLRLNFSHGTHEWHGEKIGLIRKASAAYGKPVAIIQDLQGPKIRLGDFDGMINVTAGLELRFGLKTNYEKDKIVPLQYDLAKKVQRGERMYINDGRLRFIISAVKDGVVYAKADNDGILLKRKGINLPDTDFKGDIFTKKDKEDIVFGSTQDIDYVALSFVQSAEDIENLKRRLHALGSHAKVIAKIETQAAVDNIEEITHVSDSVMVARGDLATETLPESVPITQRKIIGLGHRYAKPTIVATQMLATMADAPEPTRAEVSDIATAVLVGADCLMLSDETASGKFPIESVKVMKRVITYTQKNAPLRAVFGEHKPDDHDRQGAISNAVIRLAESVHAAAIVVETKSGETAKQIACRRPDLPLIAVTSDGRVANQLAIVYGTKSYVRPDDKFAATKLTNWLRKYDVLNKGDIIVTCSGKYPGVVGTTDTIKVRLLD